MRVITLNYEPLDCVCPHPSSIEYCDYCNLVLDCALTDYESGVGYWEHYGVLDEDELSQEEQLLALAEYFEEGRSPSPLPDPQDRRGLLRLRNFMAEYPGGEAPWRSRRLVAAKAAAQESRKSKKSRKGKKPYSRPFSWAKGRDVLEGL
ncbi:hypothetical protein RhiJN_25199 [Ceratobasidium sp. AG-Ba]|nr:hypothetical protein RhiJN_25199 [Ceratobasidium sp. AG-Ba]